MIALQRCDFVPKSRDGKPVPYDANSNLSFLSGRLADWGIPCGIWEKRIEIALAYCGGFGYNVYTGNKI